MTIFCANCGRADTAHDAPCPSCGSMERTDVPPSQEPCAYCGARPTWAVVWDGDEERAVYLCAACDREEVAETNSD